VITGLVATLCAVMAFEPSVARADVAICPSFPPPSSDRHALRWAPFAFDGVVVGGREIRGPNGGEKLVSPLTFRVKRWLKDESSHRIVLPSGVEGVRIWDGRYARLAHPLLKAYSLKVAMRFPGEIVARPGQAWRVYATNENGINFTCTNLLGSHPSPSSATPAPSPSEPSPRALASSPPAAQRSRSLILALIGAGAVALLAFVATRAFRRQRKNQGSP
jgi:hypothetical protein